MQFKDILYEVKGDYAHVTINRPKLLNAFTPVTLQELTTCLLYTSPSPRDRG